MKDVDPRLLEEIQNFFTLSASQQGKKVEILGQRGPSTAQKAVEIAQRRRRSKS